MWNPFRIRLHSGEYLNLRRRIVELNDDVGKLTDLLERIDARQRGRARKVVEIPRDDVPAPPDIAPNDQGPAVADGSDRRALREQLRARAKERGLMA